MKVPTARALVQKDKRAGRSEFGFRKRQQHQQADCGVRISCTNNHRRRALRQRCCARRSATVPPSTLNWSTPRASLRYFAAIHPTPSARVLYISPGSHGIHWEVQDRRGRAQGPCRTCRRTSISTGSDRRGYTTRRNNVVVRYRNGAQQARRSDGDRPRDLGAGAGPPRHGAAQVEPLCAKFGWAFARTVRESAAPARGLFRRTSPLSPARPMRRPGRSWHPPRRTERASPGGPARTRWRAMRK